jgi:hypothetical protein
MIYSRSCTLDLVSNSLPPNIPSGPNSELNLYFNSLSTRTHLPLSANGCQLSLLTSFPVTLTKRHPGWHTPPALNLRLSALQLSSQSWPALKLLFPRLVSSRLSDFCADAADENNGLRPSTRVGCVRMVSRSVVYGSPAPMAS